MPGPPPTSFDACVRSLLELPPDEYEVIFADDGSTDGTRKRLDALAATRSNVRVLHLERTGNPAHGRNAALSVALGEFVFLMNAHDRLEPGSLQRLFERAKETEADVLVGRLTGDGPLAAAFTRDRDRADLLRDRLLTAVTAHKLFRREFVETHQLRFADRALSEQAFVLRAYLSAKVIAVAAGHVVCHVVAGAPARARAGRLGPRRRAERDHGHRRGADRAGRPARPHRRPLLPQRRAAPPRPAVPRPHARASGASVRPPQGHHRRPVPRGDSTPTCRST